MTSPTVTVLIDTYNYGRFIEDAIDSVLAQDFPAALMETLIVDDGSTDDTAERVKKYGERVRYFHKPNGGQASAFNFGIARARGEIVALLDADDYWLPGKLRRVVEEFQKNPGLGMVYHGYLEVDQATKTSKEAIFHAVSGSFDSQGDGIFWYEPCPTSCTTYRRRLLEGILPVPEGLRILADNWLGLMTPFVAPIQAVAERLTAYRIHGKNLYYEEEGRMTVEARRKRIEMVQIVLDGMHARLAKPEFRGRRGAREFVERVQLYKQKERFLIEPPGRLRYFQHLMKYNACFGGHIDWRLRFMNYVSALGVLVGGYEHRDAVRGWFEGAGRRIWRSVREAGGSGRPT
ncbi:MAG: glycosyltransferase [Candidatus Acidiferrum sp.]